MEVHKIQAAKQFWVCGGVSLKAFSLVYFAHAMEGPALQHAALEPRSVAKGRGLFLEEFNSCWFRGKVL